MNPYRDNGVGFVGYRVGDLCWVDGLYAARIRQKSGFGMIFVEFLGGQKGWVEEKACR